MLEGALITWTKQIKAVLKLDPEHVLQTNELAGPLSEIQFWEDKASNLYGLLEQRELLDVCGWRN